ncbi:glycoside hydrolase family 16 protein [Actinomadura fulvescens]|uniref:GH16 domain-containing protein n=1 Tax=Actinomadura fulvescens TaxID=46160 RepID=A0ABN3PDA1_9ACTN
MSDGKAAWGPRLQALAAVVAGGLLAVGTAVHVVGDSGGRTVRAQQDSDAPRPATKGASSAVDPNTRLPRRGWKVVWSDEFGGRGAPSPGKWFIQSGDRGGWGVGGLAYYHQANVRRNGRGQLVIAATKDTSGTKCWYGRCQYRSGRIQTAGHFSLAYGRFAARIKFPTGKGIFPAFWLQSQHARYGSKRYAEIDIAEIFGARPQQVLGAAHHTRRVRNLTATLSRPVDSGYRLYGVDWSPTEIRWWVDGKVYGRMKRYPGWSFDQPMQIILNLQVGGKWQGPPDASTPFPAAMSVDWVRVYESLRD